MFVHDLLFSGVELGSLFYFPPNMFILRRGDEELELVVPEEEDMQKLTDLVDESFQRAIAARQKGAGSVCVCVCVCVAT